MLRAVFVIGAVDEGDVLFRHADDAVMAIRLEASHRNYRGSMGFA